MNKQLKLIYIYSSVKFIFRNELQISLSILSELKQIN